MPSSIGPVEADPRPQLGRRQSVDSAATAVRDFRGLTRTLRIVSAREPFPIPHCEAFEHGRPAA
jgi:hypothetical protein